MGTKLCSCNNREDQVNEVNMPVQQSNTNSVVIISSYDKSLTGNTETTRDPDMLAKGGNAKNKNFNIKMDNYINSYNLPKILKLQIKLKQFLGKNRSKLIKESDGLKSHRAGVDQASPEAFNQRNNPTVKANTFLTSTNFEYMGGRVNGEKEGLGLQRWKDGAIYIGIFKSNRANGLGIFKHSDGDEYKGEFNIDRACGYGLYRHSNGATYEGMWVDDCQNGVGEEKWGDSSQYVGNYAKGKKQGVGSYTWSDNSRYDGEWYENCLHGYGIYYFSDDRIYIGQWQYNTMHGYGEFRWKDGKRYLGYYIHDKKDGFGIYYWASPTPNRVYIGFWKAGRQEGVGKYINTKIIRYGLWKNGEREKWFTNEKEALSYLQPHQEKFKNLFKYNLRDIAEFLSDEK